MLKVPLVLWLDLLSEIGVALLAVIILVIAAVAVATIWKFVILPVLKFTGNQLNRLSVVQWFVNAPVFWQIRPWMVAILILQLVAYYMSSYLEADESLWYLIFVLILICEMIALVVGVIFLLLAGVVIAREAYDDSDFPDGISTTQEVVVEWFNTTKRPICPYIEIVD